MQTGITIGTVVMGLGLLGCTFEPASLEDLGGRDASSEESIGSISSPLVAGGRRMAPAAAVTRGVRTSINGIPLVRKELYVFICDDHQLKVRWKGIGGWNVGGWQAIAPDYPCDSAPTVGVIRNDEVNKRDILGVYWRSDRSLIEAWYRKDGTMAVTDLLEYDSANVPAIEGRPTVTDTSDPTRIQVVVRGYRDQVWTVKWTGSAYDSQPVLRADGSIFTTDQPLFDAVYNADNGREYLVGSKGNDEFIFSRGSASWHLSYTEYAKLPGLTEGRLTIGGRSLHGGPPCASGYALLSTFTILASCLDSGGTLTNWTEIGTNDPNTSILGGPNGSNYLFTAYYGGLTAGILAYTADPIEFELNTGWESQPVESAVVQPTNGGSYAFWSRKVNNSRHLFMADFTGTNLQQATVTDMGGNLIYIDD